MIYILWLFFSKNLNYLAYIVYQIDIPDAKVEIYDDRKKNLKLKNV